MNWDDLTRFAPLEPKVSILYSITRFQPSPFQCDLRVVLVVDTKHNRRAVLLSTDVDVDALTIYRYDKARVRMEFLSV